MLGSQANQACLENIQKIGGTPCPAAHCEAAIVEQYIHAFCNCQDPFLNGCYPTRTPGCCKFTGDTPVPVMSLNCYCCCGDVAQAVTMAYDASAFKPITDFQVGDPVYVASDTSLQAWTQRPVLFSAGAGAVADSTALVRITYGTPELNDFLVVDRTQPFLLPDRELRLAEALVPGRDALVSGEGLPWPVLALEPGVTARSVHHIATSTTPATSVDGHLLLARNVVCGDWALQVALTTGLLASAR
jgi:hypothetical protein